MNEQMNETNEEGKEEVKDQPEVESEDKEEDKKEEKVSQDSLLQDAVGTFEMPDMSISMDDVFDRSLLRFN